ncbi:acid protease [Annulohypoxylon maeteangense]|uniref:acid protease n=1 Tax=Annulohypoxylon maeteangense TaxID=1927788 RepID=UPI0020079E24|nr:acid protease [Annulohypoxylon maeteangense]KAI0882932.1 acid protease [Annulohypoxylon maeteangense]
MAFSPLSLPISLISYLAIFRPVHGATAPVAATWSDSTYGPDGPWPAVEVTLGDDQTIALYPGREFQSFLLTTDYCNQNRTLCYANQAGLYNDAQSQVDATGSTGHIQFQSGSDYMAGVDIRGQPTNSWIDNMKFGGSTIANVSLALLNQSYMAYPNGQWYPLTVGCLGIGAPDTVNQSFSNSYGPAINASLIPGYLWAHNKTASNSFGMHIGSANPKMPGSFYFGGYDQNRIVGDVLSYQDDYTKDITLKDITIKVVDGSSPWQFESLGGLLSSGNSSITSGGLQVSVDGCSPYLSLPKSTCDAIAKNLPVTYNEGLGLYYWNTNEPKYTQIVNSASVLEFVFIADSNTKNVSISVPFRHLNLTLTAPLVDQPTQYFPCYTGHSKGYTLGRAFLQDAFVGANWGTKSWWLAQAPGPNIPSANVVELANGGGIKASTNDWKESWSGSWTALTPEEASSSSTVSAPTATNTDSVDSTGLSTGAKAGIGVGVGIAGLAALGALAFFFMRRRKAAATEGAAASAAAHSTPEHGFYAPVKNPTSPGMTDSSTITSGQPPNAMMYNQQYAQYPQPYPQQYPQQYMEQPYGQQYSTELPAVGNTPTELPGSTIYDPHMLDSTQISSHASPQPSHVSPHSPSHGTDQSQAPGQSGHI